MFFFRLLAPLLLAVLASTAWAQETTSDSTPAIAITNADTVATDDLRRSLPSHADVGDPKPDRWVGLFYWQWHGDERWWRYYNVTNFLKDKNYFRNFEVRPENGPAHPTWYWAEPLFGYYRSTDPWVQRKHLVMLADAGVDFLFMDYTNSGVYDAELTSFLNVARELKNAGVAVPKLTFFFNHEPAWKIHHMYTHWYSKPEWADMWFMWRGKPLLMGAPITDTAGLRQGQDPALVPAINRHFTFRKTWAFDVADSDPTVWRFTAHHHAKVALDPQRRPEQIVVNKSLGGPLHNYLEVGGASSVPGREQSRNNFTRQWTHPNMAKGIFISHAWRNAERSGAPITLVTGWNEWKASVWDQKGVRWLGRPIEPPFGYFVDQFNEEFNRDLEPMKAGYFDAYYMQFLADMRRYKGMLPPQPVSPAKSIRPDYPSDWDDVTPRYLDPPNDTAERDHDATVPNEKALLTVKNDEERRQLPLIRYINTSARNDLAVSQVACDDQHVYFRVTTARPLSPATDPQWMWLFINTDQNPRTGWQGYDLLINRTRSNDMASVEQSMPPGFGWRTIGQASITVGESSVQIALPRILLRPARLPNVAKFDFKWADHLPAEPTIADFYTEGDTAPNGRLNFRYDESTRARTR